MVHHTLQIWQTEQRHEAKSPYRFVELGNGSLGPPVAYTGGAHLHMRTHMHAAAAAAVLNDSAFCTGQIRSRLSPVCGCGMSSSSSCYPLSHSINAMGPALWYVRCL
jgi:hypothetical protein